MSEHPVGDIDRRGPYCGYSNCFRVATAKRGFMRVCPVHLAEPRKWGKDGKTFTGSTFVKVEKAACPQCEDGEVGPPRGKTCPTCGRVGKQAEPERTPEEWRDYLAEKIAKGVAKARNKQEEP